MWELSKDTHNTFHGTPALHPHLPGPHPEFPVDRRVFDIERDRTEAQNLGFGYGIHSCLGAALARMETAVAIDRLLDFMPRYEVRWDGLERVHMQNVAGYHHVPVKVLR